MARLDHSQSGLEIALNGVREEWWSDWFIPEKNAFFCRVHCDSCGLRDAFVCGARLDRDSKHCEGCLRLQSVLRKGQQAVLEMLPLGKCCEIVIVKGLVAAALHAMVEASRREHDQNITADAYAKKIEPAERLSCTAD